MTEVPEPPTAAAPPVPGSSAPGTVLAVAILLGLGGALIVVYALISSINPEPPASVLPPWAAALYGLAYVGLAWGVYRGRPLARRITLILCVVGLALAVIALIATGPAAAVDRAVWPLVYWLLLRRRSARAWFRPEAPTPQPPPAIAG